jgi:hypothetical protein
VRGEGRMSVSDSLFTVKPCFFLSCNAMMGHGQYLFEAAVSVFDWKRWERPRNASVGGTLCPDAPNVKRVY